MKKKILCVAMTMVMIVGVLSGCGKKNDYKNTEKENITESATEAVAETEAATESIEEKDEYLTIDTSTICSRELHDFFQLYLGCWLEKEHQPDCKKSNPQGINEMLEYTGIVGAFTPAEGMRIVEDFDTDNFLGLREYGTGEGAYEIAFKHRYQLDKGTVNYSCSVSKLDANFSNFKYKAGTDAELRLFVNVKYNCSGVTNDSEEKMYAVSLVNNADNPEEWLINAIYDAHNLTEKEKEENPGYSYYVYFGYNSSQDPLFVTDKLIDEDREVVDTTNMSDWKKAYIDYFNNSPLKLSEYAYILEDVNSDNIPELFLYNSRINDREFYYINKNNEVKSIEFTKSYIRAENGCVYITGGSQGYYYDSVSQCNANGDYEPIFDGYNEEDLSGDTVSFKYYIGSNIEVSEDEYERKLSAYKDMKSFGEEDSNQGDIVSAIQNY